MPARCCTCVGLNLRFKRKSIVKTPLRPARLHLWFLTLLTLFSLFALLGSASAATLTVALDGSGQYTTIQTAINASQNGDTVLIADGIYTGPGNVDLDFGGRNITVTSQNGPATTIIDCQGTSSVNHRGFYLHSGETNAVISGLTIEDGYEINVTTVNGVTITSGRGGGIFINDAGALIQNCVIKNNVASSGGGISIVNSYSSGTVTLTNCTFSGNSATKYGGGGLENLNTSGTIAVTNCTLTGNTAYGGGGVYNQSRGSGTISLTNCMMAANTASLGGGCDNDSYNPSGSNGPIVLTNCTLTANTATAAPNASSGVYILTNNGSVDLTNCICYGDTGGEVGNDASSTFNAVVNYCDVQGGYTGTGNINALPNFVSSSSPYDLHLQAGSPCLGAGTPSAALTTLDGQTRPNPPSIGAYEAAPTSATATTLTLVSNLNPSVVGQNVVFTATLAGAGGTPTGFIYFTVDGYAEPPSGFTAGQTALSISTFTGGSHTITAAYGGDANFAPSAAPLLRQTVRPASSTTTLMSSQNPSTFNQQVTFTATVAGRNPTGAVTFTDTASGTTLGTGTLSGRTAALTTSSLTIGSHPVVASYGGDASNSASASPTLTQTVNAGIATTTLALTSSLNPSVSGQNVTFTDTVTGSGGTPMGTVTFSIDGTAQTPAALNNGSATYTLSSLAVGSHTVTASYSGDATFAASQSPPLTQTVNKTTTTTALASSLNPALLGQTITFTETITGNNPGGAITLIDTTSGTTLGGGSVSGGGPAAFTVSGLSAGTHQIVATYGGDSANSASASPPLTQIVNAAATTTTLTSSLNPSAPGQQITFTATVTGSSPTGTVYFVDTTNSAGYGPITLSGGVATLTIGNLAPGTHQFTASYSGGVGYSPSTSPVLTQIVTPVATTTMLASNLNPSISGQYVTFTATVTGAPRAIPTGTVTFTVDGTAQMPVTVSNGYYAAYTTPALALGLHTITATYNGDSSFGPSTSSALTQTIIVHVGPQYVSPSGNDNNPGTQAAPKLTIQAAINATISGDTVIVEDGTYTGPGDVDLDFGGRNIRVISQNGPATTIINCQGSSNANHRGFYLHSGENNAVISGLTIENGFVGGNGGSGNGGGIYVVNSTATIQNCTLTGNTAIYGLGGGIYDQGAVNLSNCVVTKNAAGYGGGGICNNATMTVTNCVITGNTTTNRGGGLYNFYGGALILTNCTFTGNTASNGFGGACADNGGITLVNDIFYGDTGGEVATGSATATYCDIQGGYTGTGNINANPLFVNSPVDLRLQPGSPCLGAGTPNGAPAATLDGRTRPNPPSIGAYEAALASLVATTTTLTSNLNPSVSGQTVTFTATVSGAGGTPTGTVTFTVDGTAQPPVTVQSVGGTTLVTAAYNAPSLSLGSHTITAAYSGDANFASGVSAALTQTVNVHVGPQYVSPSGSDGNPGTQAAPKLTIQAAINATLSGDTVFIADGAYTGPGDVDLDFGGRNITVTSQNGPATTIINCGGSISANHRGFYLHDGETSAVISGLTIENGYESGSNGNGGYGAAICDFSAGMTVQNCLMQGNAANFGGGIYSDNEVTSPITLTNCRFAGNTALASGGALYSYNSNGGTLTVTNCAFTGNMATEGGGLYNYNAFGCTTALTNCTLTGNMASYGGGGIYNNNGYNSGSLTLTNDILYGDTGGEIVGTSIPTNYCDIQGGYSGANNINADPLFVSGAAPYDLHLKLSSPCLRAGTHSGAPATDITGLTRPNPPSLGAYDSLLVASQTALASSLNPSAFGQSVTFTATVTGSNATGTVTFTDGTTTLGTSVVINNGTAAYTTSALTFGSHSITASYGGDSANAASVSATLTQIVQGAPTASSQSVTTLMNQPVAVTLTGSDPNTPPLALTYSVATPPTHGTLSGTTPNLTYTPASGYVGVDSFTFTASNGSLTSASATVSVTINPLTATTTTLASSLNPSGSGQNITFTATVTGSSPTGTVSFYDGTILLGTATLSSGTATFSTSSLTAGTHPVTATYSGDTANAAGTSATLTQTVLVPTTLAVSNASGMTGQNIHLVGRLRRSDNAKGYLPGETVSFKVDGVLAASTAGKIVTDSNGFAVDYYLAPGILTVGSHTLSAAFAGDSAYAASAGTGILTITSSTPLVTSLAVAPVSGAAGQTVSLTATLTSSAGGTAGKTLTFQVDGATVGMTATSSSGAATLSYAIPSGAAVGSHTITVSFAGDSGYNASTGTGTLTVTQPVTLIPTTLAVSNASGTVGQTIPSGGPSAPHRQCQRLPARRDR